MRYGDVLGVTFSVLGFLLSLQGLWLLCRAMFPNRVHAAAQRCRSNGIACFFTGAVVLGVVTILAVVIARRAGTPGQVAAWVIATLMVMYAGTGMSGFATFLGQRLAAPSDARRPWQATIRGGIALEFAFLLPIVGWFGLLPASLILGAGATTLSFFWTPRQDLQATLAANRARAIEPQELPALEPVEAGV